MRYAPNDRIHQVFDGIPRSRIALETGAHSPCVSRQLTQLSYDVIVPMRATCATGAEREQQGDAAKRFSLKTLRQGVLR
jgi:hypothetical protein